jgi:hypothetical protein
LQTVWASAGQAVDVQNRGQGFRSIGDLVGSNPQQQTGGGRGRNQGNRNNQGNQNNQGNRNNQGNQGNQNNQGGQGNQNNQAPGEPLDLQTFARISDRITISGEQRIPGKININTASWEVLVVLFGGGEQAEQAAYGVVAERANLLYGFQGIADLERAVRGPAKVKASLIRSRSVRMSSGSAALPRPPSAARNCKLNTSWIARPRRARSFTRTREQTIDEQEPQNSPVGDCRGQG